MKDILATISIALVGIWLIVLLVAAIAIVNGYTLSVLWDWFIVPTFKLPALSIPNAIGIALIVTFLTGDIRDLAEQDKDAMQKVIDGLLKLFVRPVLVLAMGYMATLSL